MSGSKSADFDGFNSIDPLSQNLGAGARLMLGNRTSLRRLCPLFSNLRSSTSAYSHREVLVQRCVGLLADELDRETRRAIGTESRNPCVDEGVEHLAPLAGAGVSSL